MINPWCQESLVVPPVCPICVSEITVLYSMKQFSLRRAKKNVISRFEGNLFSKLYNLEHEHLELKNTRLITTTNYSRATYTNVICDHFWPFSLNKRHIYNTNSVLPSLAQNSDPFSHRKLTFQNCIFVPESHLGQFC